MLFGLITVALQVAQPLDYRKDFDELISNLGQYGAYVHSDGINLKSIAARYRPILETSKNRGEALAVFENVMGELHDHHASLNSNNDASPRLVPSGADIIASWKGNVASIEQIRENSPAEKAGLKYGDQIVEIQEKPVRLASRDWLSSNKNSLQAWNWGLNSALAGRRNVPRSVLINREGSVWQVNLSTFKEERPTIGRLTTTTKANHIVVLRPENSLGQEDLIKDFDNAVPKMRSAKGIVLDLRNTPSGGDSNVARGIMGLFISRRLPFQRHRVDETSTKTVRDWVEYASPRLSRPITCPMIVLVGRWTSSMGEGIAIGFDGMHRATVVGTRMAGLRGAVDGVDLPSMGCRAFFPTEQVFHVNGTPRHDWIPLVLVEPTSPDSWTKKAFSLLTRK